MLSWRVRAGDRELRGDEKKLYTRVRHALWEYEPLRASHAEMLIEVEDDRVRLAGRVRTLPQKVIAELLVKRLEDVGSVRNELVADPEVVRSVADALAQDERTAPYVLQVDARHGLVTLAGEVPTPEVARVALEVASQAPLVAGVRSQLREGGPVYSPYALSPASEARAASTGLRDVAEAAAGATSAAAAPAALPARP